MFNESEGMIHRWNYVGDCYKSHWGAVYSLPCSSGHTGPQTQHPLCLAMERASLLKVPLFRSLLHLPSVLVSPFWTAGCDCGLRPPVRAIKTSWQGSKLFICSFLMGQHKAGLFLCAPSGPSKSTWAGGSNKQAGDSLASARQPWPLEEWAGLVKAAHRGLLPPPCLTLAALPLPLCHAAQLCRDCREQGREKNKRNNPWACLDSENCVFNLSSAIYYLLSLRPIISFFLNLSA